MRIIVIYNHKGGVSKTTTTINTATFLEAYYDKKVCIIDCDDYQWSTYNKHQREMNSLSESYNKNIDEIEKDIEQKKIVNYDVLKSLVVDFKSQLSKIKEKNYDYVFVDLGNRTLSESRNVFEIANQIIIPYSNDEDEINAAISFYNLVKESYPNVPVHCLIVKIEKSRFENHQKIKQLLKEKHQLAYYDNIIPLRTRFTKEKSFFHPLNYNTEKADFNKGLIGFVEELIYKTQNT